MSFGDTCVPLYCLPVAFLTSQRRHTDFGTLAPLFVVITLIAIMVARFNNSGSMKRKHASHNKLGMKLKKKPKGRRERAAAALLPQDRFGGGGGGSAGRAKADLMDTDAAPEAAPTKKLTEAALEMKDNKVTKKKDPAKK